MAKVRVRGFTVIRDVFGADVVEVDVDHPETVDGLCDTLVKEYGRRDDRVRVKEYEDLVTGNVTVHAFYVKYLLPIFFDVQSMEWQPGTAPTHRWQYATA